MQIFTDKPMVLLVLSRLIWLNLEINLINLKLSNSKQTINRSKIIIQNNIGKNENNNGLEIHR